MRRALKLAHRGAASSHPNPRVGCVIVRDGTIVGEGWHRRAGEPHAEALALAAAGARARGATAYVNLEPCAHAGRTPPCADALIAAGVARVIAAIEDPDPRVAGRGGRRLRDAGIQVQFGLLAEEAAALNRGFITRHRYGRPWVTLKLAVSLDGRTAMASGESRWVSGAAARAEVHRLRAEAGALLTSAATVAADDPQLTARIAGRAATRQPDRIVLDTEARLTPQARVFAAGARRRLLVAQDRLTAAAQRFAGSGVELTGVPRAGVGGLDLGHALQWLGQQGVNEVLSECGPRLAGALLAQGCVDEVLLYLAPKLFGADARPLVYLPGFAGLEQAPRLRWLESRRIGEDLRLRLQPEQPH
ncbi:MAG: bifunctional diaminohydroxyphosphoribosylaminopyrimidine deaminase/5-amino-6-(5-phosphoribosylamino)uracil reductase RibD [Gammaproteobacteria bacterium]|nr:bifunctional diaminohydroxyphosphoribosylaminopyrimidine deaminase/5-amino-6-(5-phosphoribosylamino)uracil reductase RibD [Gammaproteobacteria bacterium]